MAGDDETDETPSDAPETADAPTGDDTDDTAPEAADASGDDGEDSDDNAPEAADAKGDVTDDSTDDATDDDDSNDSAEDGEPEGFDVDAAEARLGKVGEKIQEGRQALDDVEDDETPSPDGQPIAEGDGAANAPPG